MNIRIKVENKHDNFNKMMARYRKLWRESGIIDELKDRQFHKSKSYKKHHAKSKKRKHEK